MSGDHSDVMSDLSGSSVGSDVEEKKSCFQKIKGCILNFGFESPCDPKKAFHRYLMLIFMCMLSFGECKHTCISQGKTFYFCTAEVLCFVVCSH